MKKWFYRLNKLRTKWVVHNRRTIKMKKSEHTRILSYNRILCTILSDKDKMKTIKGTLYI